MMERNLAFRCGTAPINQKARHAVSAPYLDNEASTSRGRPKALMRSRSYQKHETPTAVSSSFGGSCMSPRVMEQISAVQANRIFVDEETSFHVSPPLSAPTRLRKAFWSEEDSGDGSTEDSDERQPDSKYTVPPVELVSRRARRRRITPPMADSSRPPSRQVTAFPVHLDLKSSSQSDLRPQSRQDSAFAPADTVPTHHETNKMRDLRVLLSKRDLDHVVSKPRYDLLSSARTYPAPMSPIQKPRKSHIRISKNGFNRPPTREKTHALFLDLPSKLELEPRLVLSDRSGMSSQTGWTDVRTSRTSTSRTSTSRTSYCSPDSTPRSTESASSNSPPMTGGSPEIFSSSSPEIFSSSACKTFVPLFGD